MENKRSIEVSLKQASVWYNSDNATLRRLALTAYTENELELGFNYIFSKVPKDYFEAIIPIDEEMKYKALIDLAIIAKFYNGDWKKTESNEGYFLGKFIDSNPFLVSSYNGIGIYAHTDSMYAGIIYFKNLEDIIQAIKFLSDRINDLFK